MNITNSKILDSFSKELGNGMSMMSSHVTILESTIDNGNAIKGLNAPEFSKKVSTGFAYLNVLSHLIVNKTTASNLVGKKGSFIYALGMS